MDIQHPLLHRTVTLHGYGKTSIARPQLMLGPLSVGPGNMEHIPPFSSTLVVLDTTLKNRKALALVIVLRPFHSYT